MIEALLQTEPDWLTLWESGQWFEATFEPFVYRLTRPGAALLIAAPFAMALWQQAEDIVVPGVLLTLFMGLLLGGAPPGATIVGYLIITVAATVAYRSIFSGGPG
jgi:hypothetical protein